ncbi:alpha-ketoglutarate-dependent dioxygenase AlkB [Neisseria sp.]|uniref:alpha-ketoglutarate-dependent dioxygenase AlkB family protein n=1 Tax=Neisseria sp. TaxID=192066 RepID=UPI0026DD9432|nr:alpha-ketoglutarate-dependent dioxygenase AlkB [Neisseria sp.]MDO4226769.1 alpha-ketoglutarate-dependent dioxygenase AlkB [Neisseria sp.]
MNLDLFDTPQQPEANLLPYDGIVNDYGVIFATHRADALLDALLRDIPWRHDEAVVYGRRITTARKVAWYGDGAFSYTYSGITRTALPWSGVLSEIKRTVEARLAAVSPTVFNSCLLNLYSDGLEGMAWHSDDEKELGRNTVIASVSFGATRKFAFKHKRTGEKRELMLSHGQLLVMRGETQSHWLHAVMKSAKIHEPRINLTFRTILRSDVRS